MDMKVTVEIMGSDEEPTSGDDDAKSSDDEDESSDDEDESSDDDDGGGDNQDHGGSGEPRDPPGGSDPLGGSDPPGPEGGGDAVDEDGDVTMKENDAGGSSGGDGDGGNEKKNQLAAYPRTPKKMRSKLMMKTVVGSPRMKMDCDLYGGGKRRRSKRLRDKKKRK